MVKEIVHLGADHAGFKLKEKIKKLLDKYGFRYEDLGGLGKDHDDYPDYAFAVARKVSRNKNSRGILICGTGSGMVIAANKVNGIRAAVGYDSYSVKMGRHDNDINVLCLRGRKSSDRKNLKLVKEFLKEKFSGLKGHRRRIRKIEGKR